MKKAEWIQKLHTPAKTARDRTRWWWYGCAVEKEEISRELDEMLSAGIGGVELQILYPLQQDDPKNSIHNSTYLSPEFMERVRYAAVEAKKRGMRFDLTLGSSWPYGGPFISQELCAQNALPLTIDVQGPCSFSQDLTTVVYGKVIGALMGRMENARMQPESVVDVRPYLVDKYLFNWPWGKEIKDLPVPDGTYKILLMVENDRKMQVLKPLPGGEGLVMDHNRKDSLRCFLLYAGETILREVGAENIDNIFCDSIEVEGHNWTEILPEEFKKRRGYDIYPYLYALWGQVEGLTEAVRYDFQKTMAELTVENFFQELTAWCHENNTLSRVQAHGTWGDILQAYGAADVPEGETFSAFDRYEVNTVHRRLASSAGHVYRKPIISNESFTWLRFPRYVVTLENIKAAVDSIFLDGMNQIVNHGYSYSKSTGVDMLAFYASTNINHTNTWWKYFPKVSTYINRVCDFLQQGEPVATTAIYLPQHDIWASMPLADLHMCMKLDERLDSACVNGVQKAGYWFDYVNDEVVCNWKNYPYDTLLLVECDRIPVETLRSICEFAAAGGKVIAAERLPQLPCGLMGKEEKAVQLAALGEELLQSGAVVTADKYESLIAALRQTKLPDVTVTHPEAVGFVHRRTETEELYFISNISEQEHSERILFCGAQGIPALFDPMTAQELPVHSFAQTAEGAEVTLTLQPYQSAQIIFSAENPQPLVVPAREQVQLADLSNAWQLTVPEKGYAKLFDTLESGWEQQPELRYHSGSGCYSKKMTLNEAEWRCLSSREHLWLKLEHLGEVAEVRVNGTLAGTLVKRPWCVEITGMLRPGENTVEILVTNLLINRMLDPAYPEPKLSQPLLNTWPYVPTILEADRQKRLYNWRERQMIAQPLPAGLWGKIIIAG